MPSVDDQVWQTVFAPCHLGHFDDHAVTTIRDALGIAQDEVAGYSLPADWSGYDPEQRAKLVADWLANELRYVTA